MFADYTHGHGTHQRFLANQDRRVVPSHQVFFLVKRQDKEAERNTILHRAEEHSLRSYLFSNDMAMLLQPAPSGSGWGFGTRVNEREEAPSDQPVYALPLAQHAGVILGQSDQSLSMSLLRLASLAARHHWHVVYFDPQGSEQQAVQFAALMRASGTHKVYQYQGVSTPPTSQANTRDTGADSPPALLRWYLEATREKAQGVLPQATFPPPGTVLTTHELSSATYVGNNVWQQPELAISNARALLHSILHYVSTPRPGRPRLLLLLKHPHLLFSHDQLATLFTSLNQSNDSVFLAMRSEADLQWEASNIIQRANTLIIHRSHPSYSVTRCIDDSRQDKVRFEKQVLSLPDNDCYVLYQGNATRVRLTPQAGMSAGVLHRGHTPSAEILAWLARRFTPDALESSDGPDDEEENFLTSLFGPLHHEDGMPPSATPQPPVSEKAKRSRLHVRMVRLLTSDMAHLRRACLFLGRDTNFLSY